MTHLWNYGFVLSIEIPLESMKEYFLVLHTWGYIQKGPIDSYVLRFESLFNRIRGMKTESIKSLKAVQKALWQPCYSSGYLTSSKIDLIPKMVVEKKKITQGEAK